MGNISFHLADVASSGVKDRKMLKEQIKVVFITEGKELNRISYIFCSDSYLLAINQSYLKHDDLTDIITFDLSEDVGIIGEVYISLDRIKENAATFGVSRQRELRRVLCHGALHLCGYKDKKKSEITLMREKEEYYLRLMEEKI